MTGQLPRFIIIGAVKAATTWIAHQLRSRPDVFMPGPEPHYFSREFHRGPAWYADWFAAASEGQAIGEKSATYLADPSTAARMAELLPDVRLIVQLRNPIERAYSHYCMYYRRGHVGDDIELYLDRRRTPAPLFLDDGLYATHLTRFLDHFPREHLKIILHDEIRTEPERVIAQVNGMLGLPRLETNAAVHRPVNDAAAALLPLALRMLPRPLKALAAPFRANATFERVRGLFARPVQYPPLPEGLRLRLQDFYRYDIERLGGIVGRDLGAWVRPEERVG